MGNKGSETSNGSGKSDEDDKIIENELSHMRDRLKSHENRRISILILSLTGFTFILNLHDSPFPELSPFILMFWVFFTSSIYYNETKRQSFINSYIIYFSKINKKIKITKNFEDAYLGYFKDTEENMKLTVKESKNSKKILYIIQHPFILISIAGFLFSLYFFWRKEPCICFNVNTTLTPILLKIFYSILTIVFYGYIFKKHFQEDKYDHFYDKRIETYLK